MARRMKLETRNAGSRSGDVVKTGVGILVSYGKPLGTEMVEFPEMAGDGFWKIKGGQ